MNGCEESFKVHACYVKASVDSMRPELVVRVEFTDKTIRNAKMTVVRMHGEMDKEVNFDAMDSGWRIEGREVARK